MPGLVIDNAEEQVPGLRVLNWFDDPRLRLRPGQDCRVRRERWIRGIVLHTTKGIPGGRDRRQQVISPGLGPDTGAEFRVARYWSLEQRGSGAHLVVDFDGSIGCLADLQDEAAYHAGVVNERTIGIEIYQGRHAELYEGQLDVVVRLVLWLTARFGIQRQMPDKYRGPLARLEGGGHDVVGVYGHRDVTGRRGEGDPGHAIMKRLGAAGFERWDFSTGQDLATWRLRQTKLVSDQGAEIKRDGVPGPATVRALQAAGYPDGMWVRRGVVPPPSPGEPA